MGIVEELDEIETDVAHRTSVVSLAIVVNCYSDGRAAGASLLQQAHINLFHAPGARPY